MKVRKVRAAALLSLIPGLLGLAMLAWPPTASLESAGLDLLFLLRGPLPPPPQICVVAIDEDSFGVLDLDPGRPLPRSFHGELVNTLAREGARAVAFDLLFDFEGDPEQDAAFEKGLKEAGNVVLGSTVDQVEDTRFRQITLLEPHERFARAAAAIGDVSLMEDRDGVIRSAWLMHGDRPSLALAAYETATGDHSQRRHRERLIRYYGPARAVPTVSYYQALEPHEYLPPGFFKDKIVFVGASLVAATGPTEEKDSFRTPFRGGSRGNTFGAEIHATVAGNLVEGRQVTPAPTAVAVLLMLVLPFAAMLAFVYLRPVMGALALAGFMVLPWGVGALAFSRSDLWLPVVIPTVIQLPLAWVVSVVWYYLTTVREREKIRRAFAFYLSPGMIRRITESPGELNLGGEEIVGTAMFTDIKGFTSIAEEMSPPETAALLNEYFSEATGHVFDTGGTLIKFIGDAIFAIWGAPLRMEDHAAAACRAALGMARLREKLAGRPAGRLVTRIGVHTGPMLVGNLGSSQRFDYTAIGDTINLTARLEGLNKRFGTVALASAEAVAAAGGGVVTRLVGRVQVAGSARPVEVPELLGAPGEATRPGPEAIDRFHRALEDYGARRFRDAAEGFEAVRLACGGSDGPSELYLGLIEGIVEREDSTAADWSGVIQLTEK